MRTNQGNYSEYNKILILFLSDYRIRIRKKLRTEGWKDQFLESRIVAMIQRRSQTKKIIDLTTTGGLQYDPRYY
jgi:hypothetical protein